MVLPLALEPGKVAPRTPSEFSALDFHTVQHSLPSVYCQERYLVIILSFANCFLSNLQVFHPF